MNHDKNVTVQFRQTSLRSENPGLTSATHLRNGSIYIDVALDFHQVTAMRAMAKYANNGGVTVADVIGHEIYGHAAPFADRWKCLDDGCAQQRENVIRAEMGHRPRTWDVPSP